jgi:hypothetical protein
MTKRKSTKTPLRKQITQRVSSNVGLWVELSDLAPEDCELVVLTSGIHLEV